MSELEGTLRGNAEDSAADLRDWDDDEVRIDLTDPVADVLDTTEEEEDVDDLTAVPRFKDCSLSVCVFVGRGETRGRGAGEGETMSFLNKFVFEGILGGAFFEGIDVALVVLLDDVVEAVSTSSLVKVIMIISAEAVISLRERKCKARDNPASFNEVSTNSIRLCIS